MKNDILEEGEILKSQQKDFEFLKLYFALQKLLILLKA